MKNYPNQHHPTNQNNQKVIKKSQIIQSKNRHNVAKNASEKSRRIVKRIPQKMTRKNLKNCICNKTMIKNMIKLAKQRAAKKGFFFQIKEKIDATN